MSNAKNILLKGQRIAFSVGIASNKYVLGSSNAVRKAYNNALGYSNACAMHKLIFENNPRDPSVDVRYS